MKSSEEAIEKVMAGLREARASPGMERRILEAIEDRALVQSVRTWRRGWPIWSSVLQRPLAARFLVYGVALAGVMAVVLLLPSVIRTGHAPGHAQGSVARARRLPPLSLGLVAKSPPLQAPAAGPRSMRKSGTQTRVPRVKDVSDPETVAEREMPAVNQPAPPMPLTEQERLLLRLVHAGDPVELAMLNPEMRAKQDAQSATEFREFFPPRPPLPPIKETADEPK